MHRQAHASQRANALLLALFCIVTIGSVSWIATGCAVAAMPAAPMPTATRSVPATRVPVADAVSPLKVPATATPAATFALVPDATHPVALPTATVPATRPILPTPTPLPPVVLLPTPTPIPAAPFEPTPDGTPRTAHVPILMYHHASTPPADADIYRTDLSVPPARLAAQLDRIAAEGYTTISLYDLAAFLTQGVPLPDKPVIITFDDGYRDNFTNAFPLLKARNMTATFFVVTDFIDEQRPDYLTWDMARAMLAGGMSIGSHGRNHVSLAGKDTDYLVWQALGSLETIEHELGVRPRFVSYPAGEYDQNTIDVFQSAGYWAGVTTRQGATHTSDVPFELTRVRVRNTTTPDQLVALLQADW
jgi:peptidoglycan/xylan/chitin deacetylase (PgdA/CDA1 family)